MKNVFLRVKRNFDLNSNNFVPEYADCYLDAEFSAPKGLTGVKEMSVRIYSASYRLMGTGCIAHNPERMLKKISFQLANDDLWDAGMYRAYIYINGTAKWFCELDLPISSNYWTRKAMLPIEDNMQEKFFAEKLAFTSWWNKLYCGRFKEPLVRLLIERLYAFSNEIGNRKVGKLPNLIVTGEGETCGTKALASMILGGFITEDDISLKYCLSLGEITTGAYGWKHMEDKVAKAKAVIVEVPEMNYNDHTVNIVNLMASIIRYDTFRETTFILHGKDRDIAMMMEKCVLMNGLFTKETTFRLSSDRSIGSEYVYDREQEDFTKLVEGILDEKYGCKETDSDCGASPCKAERDLQSMVGLQRVKDDMRETMMMAMFNRKRAEMCLQTDSEQRNHMLFLGNPGTGKTTVARFVGQMYHNMGLLSKGHTVETNRSKLVGEYIGVTEKKTLEAIEEARGGVLFIDEAYTLVSNESDTKDFGKEVLNALLTVLSEPEPDMIVIFAGYEDKMTAMMKTNPGLKDRFPLTFHFDDYSAAELMEMACRSLKAGNYRLTDDAHKCLASLIEKASSRRDEYFGNGRWVHNLINQGIIKSMARRVMTSSTTERNISIDLLCVIEESDILDAERNFLCLKTAKISSPRPIGFRA
ncbi:AAA family ATPase [Bacteroides caecigallinarum]|uniref:AAA family ATPase n=1 Tax=Bacteroides caecigallinarum TaxID=1411144 RepID=UPI001959B792|nr:AAA family ATPase [Bacteroides caecigallinarum]MBM6891388.1 AAA family ATPase [Bacteroides caecigallinarum]